MALLYRSLRMLPTPAPVATPSPPPPPPPPAPGPPPGDYPTISVNQLVDDQKLWSAIQPRHGTHINPHAVIRSPNYDALAAYCPAGGAQGFVDNFNEILPWFWIYNGPAHNPSLGYRIHYRRCVISMLSKTTNTWWYAPVSNSLAGYGWDGNTNTNVNSPHSRDEGSGTRSSNFPGNWGSELWPTAVVDRARCVDAKAIAVIAECRVIKSDGTPHYGTDAEYVAAMGFDQYARARGGPFKQPNGYPGYQMDGGNSRWRRIQGGDWQSVAMITMQSVQTNQNPFAGYSPPWPYDQVPWCLSEAQVRANPPIWAI
jgi:hypothetical protein